MTAAVLGQRVLGLDVSYWQGHISQSDWNIAHSTGNREFVFIRSSRGGTTGVDQGQGTPGGGSASTLSRRYDDPRFVQNIVRATNAGIFAGAYHFSRPDIITNTGADEADHFIEMAGAWMRPGYLLPVHDLEAGQVERSSSQLSAFAVDFSDRVYEVMGIRPSVYLSQNYANYVNSTVPAAHPDLWIARWPQGSGNPFTGNLQTDNPPPSPSTANVYGEWNPNHTVGNPYPDGHPWVFWQYSSGEDIPGLDDSTVDGNVAQGDVEFLKNYLVPALWMNDSSGDWSTLLNWNSGQTPQQPPVVSGQATPYATGPLPTPRLPGAAGSGPTSGQHDTVILDRPNVDITVTLSSGSHNIRKLYVHETLNIMGGSLTINYDPTYRPDNSPNVRHGGPISAQFSGAVSLSGDGTLNVHTLQVNSTQTFTLGGGTLTFDTINLMPHTSSPAKIGLSGAVNINPLNDATATIANGSGSGGSGFIDLGGGNPTLNVANGAAGVDLAVNVPIANGGFTKSGAGTMLLGAASSFGGPVAINGGTLRYGNAAGLPSTAVVTVNSGTFLDMNGISDSIAALASDPFQDFGTVMQGAANLTLSGASGTNSFGGSINGTGTLTKNGASTQILAGDNTVGDVSMNSGSLILNGTNTTGTVTVDGGTLGGSGSVSGLITVNSGGHLAPGGETSVFTANGGVVLQPGSVLDFDLDDVVLTLGGAGLTINGGTLNFTDPGDLSAGEYSLFVYAGTLGGSVDNLALGAMPSGFNYDLVDTGSLIQLAVSNIGLAGDYNEDGIVDGADYIIWRKTDGSTEGFNEWRSNFGVTNLGSGSGSSTGSVPEPTSVALLCFAVGAWLAVRYRSEC